MRTPDIYQESIDQNKVREFRRKFGLRQSDMSDIMGFEVKDRICHWERGRACPGLINLIKLCILFQVPLQELYPDLYQQIEKEIEERRIAVLLA